MCSTSFDKGAGRKLKMSNILVQLKGINSPYMLGIHLDIDPDEVNVIVKENSDVNQCVAKVIAHWMKNNTSLSWGTLADAVHNMGAHENIVKRLRDLEKDNADHNTGLDSSSDKIEGTHTVLINQVTCAYSEFTDSCECVSYM